MNRADVKFFEFHGFSYEYPGFLHYPIGEFDFNVGEDQREGRDDGFCVQISTTDGQHLGGRDCDTRAEVLRMLEECRKNPRAVVVGERFAELLREEIGEENFATVRDRNAQPEYAEACASHDFCDANMTMLAAYCSALGVDEDTVDVTADSFTATLNAAWDYAKREHLRRAS